MKTSTFLLLAISSLCVQAARSQEGQPLSIKFTNGMNEYIDLMFRPKDSPEFLTPTILLKPKGSYNSPLSNKHTGKRLIVVKTQGNRFTNIGWVDLEAVARSETPEILINKYPETLTKEITYTVYKMVYETRQTADGRIITVGKYVPEQRTKTVIETIDQIKLRVARNGNWESLDTSDKPE